MKLIFVFSLLFCYFTSSANVATEPHCIDLFFEPRSTQLFINPTASATALSYEGEIQKISDLLQEEGYRIFDRQTLDGQVSDAIFIIRDHQVAKNPIAFEFVTALQIERLNLMEMYGLTDKQYFELSSLALGILEVESRFGRSPKYLAKELFPNLAAFIKQIKRGQTSPLSRGLTQIKILPEPIAEGYNLTLNDLNHPYFAAVATIGYLAEALPWLKNLLRKHPQAGSPTHEDYDYLIYIYSGRLSQITKGTAAPEKNIYIRRVNLRRPSLLIFYREE